MVIPVLTDRDMRLLQAIAKSPNQMATAQDIASRMGYRPSNKAIPAVTQMCRSINRRFPPEELAASEQVEVATHNGGKFLVRLAPRDRWSNAKWCLTREGARVVPLEHANHGG